MLSWLAHYEDVFGPMRLFRFITLRAMMAGITALGIGFVVGPWLIGRLRKFKIEQSFRTADEVGKLAELHASKKATPTMGGLMIFISIPVSALLWAAPNVYVYVAVIVYAALTAIGFADDF